MNWLETPISLRWMVNHHTYSLYLIMSHLCWPLWTHHGDGTVLSASPGVCLLYKTSFIIWWTRYLTTVMLWLGLEMLLSTSRMIRNMIATSTSWWKWLMNMVLCSMVESVLSNKHPITFFGCVYDKDGADPSKVSAVQNRPVPQTPMQVQTFLSMVTYISPFMSSP